MSGILNDVLNGTNVNFSGVNSPIGQVTTNGQLMIGATAAPNIKIGTLTSPDASITIGYSSPNITLVTTSSSTFPWTNEAAPFVPAVRNGYFITAASVTCTLPAAPTRGDTIVFTVDSATASSLVITANAGQIIRVGLGNTAVAGTLTNNARGDSLTLVYSDNSTAWVASSVIGTWT